METEQTLLTPHQLQFICERDCSGCGYPIGEKCREWNRTLKGDFCNNIILLYSMYADPHCDLQVPDDDGELDCPDECNGDCMGIYLKNNPTAFSTES